MGKKKYCYILLLAWILGIYIMQIWVPATWAINDDWGMKSILSGAYLGNPDAHSVFESYLLSIIFNVLYTIWPVIPWYAILFNLVYIFCYILVSRSVVNKKSSIILLVVTLMFLSGTTLESLYCMQFTVVSAVCSATVCFTFLTNENKDFKQYVIHSVPLFILIFLAYSIRKQVLFMSFPFAGMMWLDKIRNTREWRKLGIFAGLCLAELALLICSDYMGYHDYSGAL